MTQLPTRATLEGRGKLFQRTEPRTTLNHSQALIMELAFIMKPSWVSGLSWTCRGDVPSPFPNRNVYNAYPITIPSLCVGLSGVKVMYHCTYRCFSQKEEFSRSCFRGIMFKSLIFTWINNLNERILDTELEPVLQVRLWGNYSFHTGVLNYGGQKGDSSRWYFPKNDCNNSSNPTCSSRTLRLLFQR